MIDRLSFRETMKAAILGMGIRDCEDVLKNAGQPLTLEELVERGDSPLVNETVATRLKSRDGIEWRTVRGETVFWSKKSIFHEGEGPNAD